MSRYARIVLPGRPYHITQRGNNKNRVFFNATDYQNYLYWLQNYAVKNHLRLAAYCLMYNHIHLIAYPLTSTAMAMTLKSLHMRYAQYLNKKRSKCGHVWQGRYYSCVMDSPHLRSAIRYVEVNPVRAGLVKEPWDWVWSSARYHIGESTNDIVELEDIRQQIKVPSWKNYLQASESNNFLQTIRKRTLSGSVLGSKKFVKSIETIIGREIYDKPGRPHKKGDGCI